MDDESYAVVEEILRGDEESRKINFSNFKPNNHEWHTVSYRHRNKHSKKSQNFDNSNSSDVLDNLDNFTMKSDSAAADEKGNIDAPKVKKAKKPKMTICDVATKIDAFDLAAFLFNIKVLYEKQEDILLMRFMDYFGREFGSISASQFPWVKMLKESTVEKMIYVAIFVVLAMTLRGKPEVLATLMPILRDISKYQGQDKLPVTVWVISQACQGDLAVGLFMWVNLLLPMLSTKPSCNPQSRDLILQVVERILASPKASRMILNGVVRKGECLVPPNSFELLVRATFPASSARIMATERFEVVYPKLKEVDLVGPPGRKVMKQLTKFAIKAAGERVPEISKEASNIAIWCLSHHQESYRQWVSTATLTSFKKKNARGMGVEGDGPHLALVKEAEKLRKMLVAWASKSHTCLKGTVFVSAALAVGATAALAVSHNTDYWDLKKLVTGFV